jgi:crotonobetainyl-CoA:carnitine CoA-transferase CaiB-like acyl-CoA transferase
MTNDAPPRQGPLSHVRVLDLSRIMAAPWATQILADLGADVIKVERPDVGDDTRTWGPPFLKDRSGKPSREAGYFLSVNRGKRSVTLDIATPRGQEVVRRLAAISDIVIENYKVGTLARYGLDYESVEGGEPGPDLRFGDRLRPDRAAGQSGRVRLRDPGHGRPDERHRRAG